MGRFASFGFEIGLFLFVGAPLLRERLCCAELQIHPRVRLSVLAWDESQRTHPCSARAGISVYLPLCDTRSCWPLGFPARVLLALYGFPSWREATVTRLCFTWISLTHLLDAVARGYVSSSFRSLSLSVCVWVRLSISIAVSVPVSVPVSVCRCVGVSVCRGVSVAVRRCA